MTFRADVAASLVSAGVEPADTNQVIEAFVDHYLAVAQHNVLAETVGLPRHPDSHPQRERIALLLAGDRPGNAEEE